MKRLILALSATLLVSGCATPAPTLYRPAASPGGTGYSEYRIEPGRYRITFQGGPGAPPRQVEDLALLRAADLALAEGYEWFRVSDRALDGRPDNGPRLSIGIGGATFGRHSSVGIGVGQGFSLGGGPSAAVTLEVVMGRGERPRGLDIYDARGVRQSLGGREI